MARIDPRDAAIQADEASRFSGSLQARKSVKAPRGAAVYLLTSAQNNTHVHAELWRNLTAYAAHLGARLLVSQFTYNKSGYLKRDGAVKPGSVQDCDYDDLWYADEIAGHVFNERLALTKNLTFCGEVNILPTAERPLSGFENYTGRSSGIFPHAKQAMQSIASLQAAKFNYTTGACTLRNYLQKKAGLKGEYQHAYGALIVEVDECGDWFVRQLRATEDGAFQDLDIIVRDGQVSAGHRVEYVWWGDIHVDQMDPVARAVHWGRGGMLDTLRPRYQFFNDTLDFLSRNHHEMRNPHEMFRKWHRGLESVEKELQRVADFLAVESWREWCQSIDVDSNHGAALLRWLRECDFRLDPVNAEFYLRAQELAYRAIAGGREDYNLLADLLRRMGVKKGVRFLAPGESFVVCKSSGGTECGMHGHVGPNGARGSANAFGRMSRKTNTGHTHSAGIYSDAFIAGTCSLLRMGYNKAGPSSWSHSDIVGYPNGCRTIVTLWRGKWRGRKSKRGRAVPQQ
jgi:hypothetical protein